MRLGCLGGNIGGFYHFGLEDGSDTPSLGINLIDKLDIEKLLEDKQQTKHLGSLSLSRLRKHKGNQGKPAGISEFGGENLEV